MSIPKRIQKETQSLANEPPPGISATPEANNYRHFKIVMSGPEGTPYDAGHYKMELFLPEQYPMEPPKVRFLTPIYHPNIIIATGVHICSMFESIGMSLGYDRRLHWCVRLGRMQDKLGRICLDILKDKWSPALQIRTVLLSIQALLSAPEPNDPLDATVADHFKANRAAAENTAREWNARFAMNWLVNTNMVYGWEYCLTSDQPHLVSLVNAAL